jgi:methyl-accepting chemotaxis protein
MKSFSIRTQLCVIIGLLCVLALSYSAVGVFDAIGRDSRAQQVATLTQISRELMRALLGIRLERATTTIPLAADPVADPFWTESIAANRQKAEAADATIKQLTAGKPMPSIADALSAVSAARDRILKLRPQFDAALKVPKSARDPALIAEAGKSLSDYLDVLTAATNVVDTAIRTNDGTVDAYLAIKRAAWNGRVTAGMVAGRIQTGIAAGRPWSLAETMAAGEERGSMARAWIAMTELIGSSAITPRVSAAYQQANAMNFAGNAAAERKALSEALSSGQPIATPLKELQARDTANQQLIVDLAYAALDEMVDRAALIESGANSGLAMSVLTLLACASLAAISLYVVFRRIAGPLVAMSRSVRELARGNLSVDVPSLRRSDEIGAIAASVAVFKENLVRTRELEDHASSTRELVERKRKELLANLAMNFEQSVGEIVGAVASSAHQLEASARVMSQAALETSNRSTTVAAAAQVAASNVTMVAASAEELGASVKEIGRRVQQSSQQSTAAVTEATEAAAIVRELSHSATRINDVLSLISTIAGQTNLLALNATIEAARAGETGRGFAVVAAEVKELANQTAKATAEISDQVNAIQSSTDRAVSAIGGITSTIGALSEVATLISSSVAEQGAATNEIVQNISQASSGTSGVTDNITGVASAAADSGSAAAQVLSSSADLARKAEQMRAQVDDFLRMVRAA